jgi:acetylglutamate kinase
MNPISVIKIGGTLLKLNKFPQLAKALAPFLRKHKSVLVHGGGKEVTQFAQKLSIPTRFVNGRRFTDDQTMEVVEMVLNGKINPYVAAQLRLCRIPALGLSGRDGGLVLAKQVKSLGRVGLPVKVRSDFILKLIRLKQTPVLASIAEDQKGNPLNVNADEMASAIAASLKAKRLILFTDVPGILDQQGKTIPQISLKQGREFIQKGVITGGMIPKIQSAFHALKQGVQEIWILHGKLPLSRSQGTLMTKKPSNVRHPFASVSTLNLVPDCPCESRDPGSQVSTGPFSL